MVEVKRLCCAGRKTMILYDDGTIAHKNNSNVISNPSKWLYTSVSKNHRKTSKIKKINNGGVETTPFF